MRRAAAVYGRFRRQKLEVVRGPIRLVGPAGSESGYLDQVRFTTTGVGVVGWTRAPHIEFTWNSGAKAVRPALARADVPVDDNGLAHGFSLQLDVPDGGFEARQEIAGLVYATRIGWPTRIARVRAEQRVLTQFVALLIRHLPQLHAYLAKGDLEAGNLLRAKTGLFGSDDLRLLSAQVFPEADDGQPERAIRAATVGDIHVIVPVHGQAPLVREVLGRLDREPPCPPFKVVVIDDASPGPEICALLRAWQARQPARYDVIVNERNKGFVASVNSGLARAASAGAHAVILNSDTLPPPGFLARLMAPIADDPSVATVTPFSNDAEILSVPLISRPVHLVDGVGDRIDLMAQRFEHRVSRIDIPVGIGFCMAINRDFLAKLPLFDPAFGRGYGEEVDWCRKAEAIGGRHVGLASLFVHHIGGASFGSAEKAERVKRNNALVARRHPRHDAGVQVFIERDPAFDHRFALALAMTGAETDEPIPVIVAHSLGGGAEKWLRQHIADRSEAKRSTVVLRVGGPVRWRIELHRPNEHLAAGAEDDATVEKFLGMLARRRIVYSCGVGTPDPAAMIAVMTRLASGNGNSAEVMFHDYFPVSPNYTLLGRSGVFEEISRPSTDPYEHRWPGLTGLSFPMELREWQERWGAFLAVADTLRVFSHDTARRVRAAYPTLDQRLKVSPHRLHHLPPKIPAGSDRVIGILGDLNRAKGAEIVARLSETLTQRRAEIRLAHLGNMDPSFRMARGHVSHGGYRLEHLPALVERYGIACWLMPSVWPETFSYATHEMIATGLPVFCFPLGAQAEAVEASELGHLLSSQPHQIDDLIDEIASAMGWIGGRPRNAIVHGEHDLTRSGEKRHGPTSG